MLYCTQAKAADMEDSFTGIKEFQGLPILGHPCSPH